MSLKTFHKIEVAIGAAALLLIALWVLLGKAGAVQAARFLGYGIVALLLGWVVLALIFRRCPHCRSFFRRYRRFCGQCGKELDW